MATKVQVTDENKTDLKNEVDEKAPVYPKRDPFPLEIETDEEKNHPLKRYKDIAERLEQIRVSHLDGTLYDAHQKCEDLMKYIAEQYASNAEELLASYRVHPRYKLITDQLQETKRMLDFLTSEQGWTLYKDDGIWKTEWQESDESDFESFRITGIGDVPLYNILAVIYEMDLINTWMPLCKESIECGQLSLHCKCGLIRVGLFWPIQDRETILFGYGIDDLKNGKLLIYFDSRDSTKIQIPQCPKGRVRVDVFLGGFYFERLTRDQTKITVVWNCDPKMSVPTSIINWFAGTFAATLVQQIVNAAQFDEKSEYFKRIQNNPEFYGKIKKKLDESMTMSDLKEADNQKGNVEQKEEEVEQEQQQQAASNETEENVPKQENV